ncbi:MAG TPA: ABC transporter ATP-binding protein [Saprospiraceae bacterium]|nr:ABC transporter ATP-binding protein [Saprospiraceae bacterium]
MRRIRQLVLYLKPYKSLVGLNIISNLLMVFFSIISIPVLIPFLEILLDQKELTTEKPVLKMSVESIVDFFNYRLSLVIIEYGKEQALIILCFMIVLVYFFKNLFRYLSLVFLAPVRNGIIRDVRQQLFEKTLILPLSYFSEERKGDLMSRMAADVQEIEWSILNVLETVAREPLMIIGALALMLYLSPALTLFVLVLIIFTSLVIGGIGRNLKKQSNKVQEKLGELVSMVEETLSGLRIIKGFTAEKFQSEKFSKENNAYRSMLNRLLWRRDLSSPLSEFMGVSMVTVLIWYGFRQVQIGDLTVAAFLAFLYAFFSVIEPAKKFSTASYNIQKGIAAVERVEKILMAENHITNPETPALLPAFQKSIEFKNVSFFYKTDETQILQNINLTIPRGKTVALVGASGAGKSTIADLLPRFYEVTQGQILIDGIDIRQLKISDLRAIMGIVSQEAILFNDSIYNNIVFGKEGVGMEQVIEAAKIANAHDFIMSTEKGYETNIGDRGMKLSGGQRQRLTIARAVLKNPPILILDEATSALDSESERLVQEALTKLLANRTSLVIAHRLSTIQHADEIIVLRAGKIIERGTHFQLLENDGEYKKLVALQSM